METYKYVYPIVASDMDITYHITPNPILLYFQDSFARYLSSKRLAAFDIIDQNLIWVITEIDINVIGKRPLWSDQIQVEIEFAEISSVRIYVNYKVLDSNGIPFVEGTSCWVIINSVTKRPFAAREMLHEAGICVNPDSKKKEIKGTASSNQELYKEVQHQVNVTDLDFNGHVCNRSYLSIAMGTAPLDFIKTHAPKRFHIKFVREAFFGELLTCELFKATDVENVFWHKIISSQEKEICSIYSEWETEDAYSDNVAEIVKR